MPLDAEDFRRLQDMLDRTVPRGEYEGKHTALVERVTKLEMGLAEMARYILAELEKTRLAREQSSREAMKAIEDVQTSVDGLKDSLAEKQAVTLRSIIGYVVTFLLGGGAISIFEYLRGIH